jgi:hypothetical protein
MPRFVGGYLGGRCLSARRDSIAEFSAFLEPIQILRAIIAPSLGFEVFEMPLLQLAEQA